MEKTVSEKPSRVWFCPNGCDLSKTACPHLDQIITDKITEPRLENVNTYVGNNIDKYYYESGAGYVIPPGIKNRSYEYKFRSKLQKAGLEPIRIDILVCRFVYDMDLRDITMELGIVSLTTVHRLLKESLIFLKKKKGWNK